ncbi:MAG: Rab geranylgeranyltransferase, partial [Tremellales sp. Tagirdzhanova-0007]
SPVLPFKLTYFNLTKRMHGVKRTRINPQVAEARRSKELINIESYVSLQEDVMTRRRLHDFSSEALGRTTDLLDRNPEFYTVWNYRRHILLRGLFPNSHVLNEIVQSLSTELKLTTAYLRVHPKVYWIWNHRKWCLESVPLGPDGTEGWRNEFWKIELTLVEKMHDADSRNFHAWGYRRYVLANLPQSFTPKRTAMDELKYTQKKIEANFSNFSAWHCRTKILEGIWEGMEADDVEWAKNKEFELVTQALWTDPGDQSGWLYHRWLMGSDPSNETLRREMTSIRELHEMEPDSKWCMHALAQYALQLSRSPSTSADGSRQSRDEARGLLKRMEEVDIDRKQRYHDMAKEC